MPIHGILCFLLWELGYATTAIVALIKKNGAEPIAAWRYTFLSFTVVGAILLLIPAFAIAEFIICFVDIFPSQYAMQVAVLFSLFVSLPFAVLNIVPGSMMADVIRYDTMKSGINQEGTFAAAKSFMTKLLPKMSPQAGGLLGTTCTFNKIQDCSQI